jgi:hypothetical protein
MLTPKRMGKVGQGPTITVTVAPTAQSDSGTSSFNVFSAVTVTVTGGTPTAYNWTFTLPSGGTFGITSGQGTATATPNVINVVDSASATFVCTVTIGGQQYQSSNSCFLSYLNTGGGGPPPI